LHDRDDSRLAAIRAQSGIEVENGPRSFVPIEAVTTDLAAGIDGADLIAVCTGGNGQPALARALAPLLRDGQVILLVQGNTGGSLVVRRQLAEAGCVADVDVAEIDTYPYSTARPDPVRARIVSRKRWNQIAAFPGRRGEAVMTRLGPLFPEAVLAANVLHTGLTNMNGMFHVANCVANVGRIEGGADFTFYGEGVTPAVANLYESMDAERLALAARLGVSVPSIPDWIERAFGKRAPTLAETFQRLTFDADGPYRTTPTPTTLAHPWITEDVPTGLMPMSALGVAAGVSTPAIDAVIRLACVMAGRDFVEEQRTIEAMGLAGQDAAQIRTTVDSGFA
ncbi:MAG: NAD/NADP octopine/nopaline dehydrogenase family protein, partial [Dehalococcoidia bacterium]